MLTVSGLRASYGRSQVLFGVDFEVHSGEVVGLLGRNGMGKTTTVTSIMGLVEAHGEIVFDGVATSGLQPYRIAQLGIGWVPEQRRLFPNLTLRENLVATAANRRRDAHGWTLDKVIQMFPGLTGRMNNYGNQLSGGEQQMAAIGRALLTNPKLLVLDEATEGLAPVIRNTIWQCLAQLKTQGQSILVIDKNLDELATVADREYILEKGRIVWSGTPAELGEDNERKAKYLGVG